MVGREAGGATHSPPTLHPRAPRTCGQSELPLKHFPRDPVLYPWVSPKGPDSMPDLAWSRGTGLLQFPNLMLLGITTGKREQYLALLTCGQVS